MALRTIEISDPAEIHVKNGQLQITNENGIVILSPTNKYGTKREYTKLMNI